MKRLMRDEKGQALILTLLLLLVGSLIVTPVLNFIGTGVNTGRTYEQKDDEIYAADSGVEDALWHIRNDTLNETLISSGYNDYDYSTTYPYPYQLFLNGKNVTVSVQNIWIPKDISTPSPSTARQIIYDEKLIIVGYPSSTASTYTIKIVYNWDTAANRDALRVKTIGIWLSPGFEYVTGSSDFEKASGPLHSDPAISLYKGGQAVVWTFASQPRLRQDFPLTTDISNPTVRTFNFQYTSSEAGQIPELVSSWVDTTGVSGVTYSWDDSIRLYKIASQAGGVHIEAYGAKTKFRKLKSTISSDYTVAGNTLMISTGSNPTPGCSGNPNSYYRERLYAESNSTIQRISLQSIPGSGIVPPEKIPEEAIIDNVYLYWSGWIDPHYAYKSGSSWSWQEIPALKYPASPTPENLRTLIEGAKVNKVKFKVDSNQQTVTCNNTGDDSTWQIKNTWDSDTNTWAYSCFVDVTDLTVSGNVTVQKYIENAMKSNSTGSVTFTVGHADEVRGLLRPGYSSYNFSLYNIGQLTGYPLGRPATKLPSGESCYQSRYQWAWAGWSLIIFYRSPGLIQRQLYLFDDFRYRTFNDQSGAGDDPSFNIGGFLAPPVISGNDTSHLAYFVGEGDNHYSGDSIRVNNMALNDTNNPWNNVFNSFSNALLPLTTPINTHGVDVDTFVLPSNCIRPYDASANITLDTNQEIYFLVYLIVSFRSELTTGGIITNYSVRIG